MEIFGIIATVLALATLAVIGRLISNYRSNRRAKQAQARYKRAQKHTNYRRVG